MKKYYFVLAAVAAMLSAVACNKEQNTPDNSEPSEGQEVTIKVTIPEDLSKVALEYVGDALELTWSAGDKIRVAEHGNASNYQDFTLSSGEGTKNATFTGTAISAASYDITLSSGMPANPLAQTQSADESTAHLGYSATLSGVNTYDDVTFSSAWASANGGGTLAQSGALHLQVTLPSGVAETINLVTMVADKNIFGATGTMTVTLTNQEDNGNPDILDVYATIPAGGVAIPSGTGLLFKFGSTNASHTVYTRYYKTPSALNLAGGQLNLISLTGTNTDKFAGKDDDGTAEHPYLIADKYQMLAVNGLMASGATKYFKLVDDINMSGETWTMLNSPNPYDKLINFDGNNKEISNLGGTMFYVFKGSIKNLTLKSPTISSGNARGALAQYVQGTGHTLTNVDVCDVATFDNSATKSSGGLIGTINTGTEGVNSITITDCDVTNVVVNGSGKTAGFIGWIENAQAILVNCTCTGNTVTNAASHYTGGLIGYVDATSSSPVTTTITLTDCYTDMVVNGASGKNRVGGLVGMIERADGSITRCYAKGDINGRQYNGGLVGTLTIPSGKSFSISESAYLSGTITVTGNINAGIVASSEGAGSVSISNCYSNGTITGNGPQRAGGILGTHHAGTTYIDHCYFSGRITVNAAIGGIVGWVNANGLNVNNCMSAPVELHATQVVDDQERHASGLIIGQGRGSGTPTMIVDHCYRIPSANFLDYSGLATINVKEDHAFITGTPAAIPQRHDLAYGYYHHGQEKDSATLSALAQRDDIGGAWSGSIWDFNQDNPRLKWML